MGLEIALYFLFLLCFCALVVVLSFVFGTKDALEWLEEEDFYKYNRYK